MSFKFQVPGLKYLFSAILFFFLTISSGKCYSQTEFPQNYFTSPMFLPLNLAGNFGQIRSNHFHSGIDIKTNEQEGQVVMAAADGYISRIKISPVGFGKAIYINHPNGYTTVYGHLQRFNDSIQSYLEAKQYKKESFDFDELLDSNLFPVKQGQFIALSGNTGGSEGPHLHFEIRNTISEHPINPLLFGYHLEDSIAPVIKSIKIYQLHDSRYGFINDTAFHFSVTDPLNPMSKDSDTIFIFERTAFSIEAFDKMNDTSANLGINKIELWLDDSLVYTYLFDEFSFDESRFVNGNIDYEEKINDNKRYILLFRLPGNNFSMFKNDSLMTGLINVTDTLFHNAEIKVSDFNGNVAIHKLKLKVKGKLKKKILKEPFISWKKQTMINKPGIKVTLAKNSIYNVYPLTFKQEKKIKGTYSSLFTIGDETIPIHSSMTLSLKPINLPPALYSKATIVSASKKGYLSSEGGDFFNGWIACKVRHFGKFTIAIDTIVPEIKEPEVYTDSITNKRILFTTISDNLSGIKTYNAALNGKWLLMEYDEKSGRLSCESKNPAAENKSELVIEVIDRKENKGTLKAMVEF